MIERVFVDFQKTFEHALFLGIDKKMARPDHSAGADSTPIQAIDKKSGLPKWTAAVAVGIEDNFGNTHTEVLNITIIAERPPEVGMQVGTPVTVEGLVMGVMKSDKNGFTTFFTAKSLKPVS